LLELVGVENEPYLHNILIFLHPTKLAKARLTKKNFKIVIDYIVDRFYKGKTGLIICSTCETIWRKFPGLQIYITAQTNSAYEFKNKTMKDMEGFDTAITLADNLGDQNTRKSIVERYKKNLGKMIETEFLEALTALAFLQRRTALTTREKRFRFSTFLLRANRYMIINEPMSHETSSRLQNALSNGEIVVAFQEGYFEIIKLCCENKSIDKGALREGGIGMAYCFYSQGKYGNIGILKYLCAERKELINEEIANKLLDQSLYFVKGALSIIMFILENEDIRKKISKESVIKILDSHSKNKRTEFEKEILKYIAEKFGIEQ
jgi:hypothetical protein